MRPFINLQTRTLREAGYWASYNRPAYEEHQEKVGGNEKAAEFGAEALQAEGDDAVLPRATRVPWEAVVSKGTEVRGKARRAPYARQLAVYVHVHVGIFGSRQVVSGHEGDLRRYFQVASHWMRCKLCAVGEGTVHGV